MTTSARRIAAGFLLVALVTGRSGAPAVADTAVDTVAVGEDPVGVAVNPTTGRVYVTNTNSDDVTVLAGGSGEVLATVTAGDNPADVAVNATTNRVYVVNRSSDEVTVISGATNAATSVPTGMTPVAVAVNERTNRVYVASYTSGTVTVIDGATNAVSTITAGSGASAVAVNESTNTIYVANARAGTVTVIDGATGATASVTVGSSPQSLAVNEATNTIYVANVDSASVTVIDGASRFTATVAVGRQPIDVAVNERTNRAYVANVTSNTLTVLEGATVRSTITVGSRPTAVAVNATSNKVYVANADTGSVSAVDGATGSAMSVRTGANPRSLAVNESTNRIFVASAGDDDVTIVDGSTPITNVTIAQTRVAGADRYATAAALTTDIAAGVATAYVTTGEGYPDALALGPIAGMDGAALLLVRRDAIPSSTASALDRLDPDRIVVIGGTGAISTAVEQALGAHTDGAVERVAGTTRFETAVRLSSRRFPGKVATVHLVSGEGFADAVSTGQAAGAVGGPVLLVGYDDVPDVVAAELVRLSPTRVVIAGGPSAVSSDVETEVRELLPGVEIARVAGTDRYATAVGMAERAVSDGGLLYVATGIAFADALAATPAAIRARSPLVLVPSTGMVSRWVIDFVTRLDPERLVIVGGTAAIPQAIIDQLS